MTQYKFTATITIDGIDREDAIWTWNRIAEMTDILDTNCIDIEEIN